MKANFLLLLLAIGSACTPSNAHNDPHAHMRVNALYRTSPTQAALQDEAFHPRRQAQQGVVMPEHATIYKTLVFAWKTLSPDGGPARPLITINGQFPGPTIIGNAGDRLVVKVINNLDVPSSIHWHGFYQNGTNNMDGIPGVTQYAIMPGQTFVYNFTLDIPGSYWYHSHYRTQYVDGLYGTLIVRDPALNEHMLPTNAISVADYYWNNSDVLTQKFLDPANKDGNEPVPDSVLINGVGQINCGGKGQPKCKYAKLTMGYSEPCDCTNLDKCRAKGGVTRLINSGAFATVDILIDEHLMWLVAADTVPIVPTAPVSSIRLNCGQRYDVVVCRNISRKPNGWTKPAWIRARMDQSTFPSNSPHPNVLGVLTYKDQCQWRPQTTAWSQKQNLQIYADADIKGGDVEVIDPYKLQPLPGFPKPPPSTVTIKLAIDIFADPKFNNSVRAHFNNMSQIDLANITTPLLNLAQAKQPYPKNQNGGPNVITINYNDVVDVIINNHDEGEHPIHLHGHNFWIMSRGMGDFEKFDEDITHTARDTATVKGGGHLAFRFTARNRGIWLMHCHIDWHMAAGLGVIWSSGLGQ